MKSSLRREQTLKLKAYSRLEEVISDVSLGQVAMHSEESGVWVARYQVGLLINSIAFSTTNLCITGSEESP